MTIRLENLTVKFDERFQLNTINWELAPNQHWVITGTNGSGKSALAAVLASVGESISGTIEGLPAKVGLVSFEAQAELIAAELKKDDADIMDVISVGTPVRDILNAAASNTQLLNELVEKFALTDTLERSFRTLSTGESRKVMLIRALASQPDLLVLDEPFDGLDANTLVMLQQYLASLIETIPMVMVLNRFDEFPDFITHIAYMDHGELKHQINRDDEKAYAELYQLLHLKTSNLQIPAADPDTVIPRLDPEQPLVRLNNITIKYADHKVIDSLDWTIQPNQHWQLSGPNGSGKTALLSLITGDHPQCYVNNVFVFGFQRGSGESIWQIKQFIGYVSTALQWEYRVGTGLRNVIISGFYDSIGLYSKYTDRQREIANQWLALLGMSERADQPFNKLSYGDQRLLLIARAMVKHPPLLILDEPCLGLDDMNRQLVLALIEKICADSETSVIYVNHHPEDQIKGIDNYLALEKH
ncbi:molybdate ABC transporter ATP-binding protein ModF [Neptunomonas antarctica]|uniref:Molybdate transport system ATP-binding protein n=1 Tax=Neptunomonas antarctica TaxID=619304 RepID=A0A1N7N3E0_9GAMM|nr:molybdate ABC transporter ATP-binding protein ModF [Neptunomonas antarctica]SIS92896.1 molybdate transport system ATP-binding protein [Neptunomonas antarctica]